MQVEILFTTAAKPKRIEVDDVYTKGILICFQLPKGGGIIKHPEGRIFSIHQPHEPHAGTTRKEQANGGQA